MQAWTRLIIYYPVRKRWHPLTTSRLQRRASSASRTSFEKKKKRSGLFTLSRISRMPSTAQLPSRQPSSPRISLVPRTTISRPSKHWQLLQRAYNKSWTGLFRNPQVPIIFSPGSLQSGFSRQPHFPGPFPQVRASFSLLLAAASVSPSSAANDQWQTLLLIQFMVGDSDTPFLFWMDGSCSC